jgi:hypothetical protein
LKYYCRKKQKYLTERRALKKCVGINLKKRGRVCPALEVCHEVPVDCGV